MTPRLAVEIAMRAERKARDFFSQLQADLRDAGASTLVQELAHDAAAHIASLEDMLERLPQPFDRCPGMLGDPTEEQQM